MATDAVPVLTVLRRGYCHPCDDMIVGRHQPRSAHRSDIVVADIDHDPRLEECYGSQASVLPDAERKLCQHFLDGAAGSDFQAQFR